jgi:exosome complex component CSL4
MTKKQIVMPGDQLSTSEELLPGEGTFEENGVIRASRLGEYVIDEKYKKARVKPLTSIPVTLKKGDIVLAGVTSVRPMMIVVDVQHVTGKNRSISGESSGTIHASEITQSYVKDASTEYRIGDIVLAKVIQVQPSLQLTTKEQNLGAIKALCTKCRHVLIKKDHSLECENCGNKERRTIALDYGNLDIEKL